MIMAPMDTELNLGMFFRHAVRHASDVEIVTAGPAGTRRYSYGDFGKRTRQLMNALDRLGLAPGDVVGTLAYNSDRHLESYFGIPCSGRILHTVNPRLSADDLAYTLREADDRALVVDRDFLPLLARIPDALGRLKTLIVIGGSDGFDLVPTIDYDELIADESDNYTFPSFPERTPLGMCFTSGTTGRPKGVVYTHRSSVLHAMGIASGAAMAISPDDCVCVQVPMFHANCFGMPHAAAASGSKQVFQEGPFDPAAFVRILKDEEVTFTAGVPTIWQMVAAELTRNPTPLPSLRMAVTAGSRPSQSLVDTYATQFGLTLTQAWGMTEGSPVISVARPTHAMRSWDTRAVTDRLSLTAGVPLSLVEVAIRDEEGNEVPWDGETMGQAFARGPWIAGSYLDGETSDKFTEDGWLATGDTVVGAPDGHLEIVDRMKDLVKSGGEWISSVAMENAIAGMTDVADAAVVAVPDAKWGERPLPCLVLRPGTTVTIEQVHAVLQKENFERWQLPDRLEILQAIPRTSVGKVDKRSLRAAVSATGDQ
jgi:fatty-acyl-CoA synthase